jgi:pyruvate/2-oxoglutarate dehydrogenase complex dihydrolipoamide dehydrogenase (E3) component
MAYQRFDLLIIGSGPAGTAAARMALERGVRVAMIERDYLGGTCLNFGCDPTKALLEAARVLHEARQAERLGLRIPTAEADWRAVQRRVREVVDGFRGGTDADAERTWERRGLAIFRGDARFVDAHQVAVAGDVVAAERVLIATGSKFALPPIPGLERCGCLTNREAIWLDQLPRSLAVIGAGPLGVEFAQMFARFGVAVTLLEHGDRLLAREDQELAQRLRAVLVAEGIRVETNVDVHFAEPRHGQRRFTMDCGGRGEETLDIDAILLATGRRAAIDGLGLEAAGVEVAHGRIATDATLRTSVPHIWAAGDACTELQFTHVAAPQGRLAALNALTGGSDEWRADRIPWVTFTDPELAHLGQTEEQLRQAGIPHTVRRVELGKVARARIEGRTEGLIKVLVGSDDRLLGAHVLAPHGGDLLAPFAVAMQAGVTATALAETVLPYPTLSEAIRRVGR